MHTALRWISLFAGLAVTFGTLSSVFTTLVVPRATSSRFLWAVTKLIGRVMIRLVRLFPTYESRDRVIAIVGPFCMVFLFVVWLSSLVLGFGLLIYWHGGTDFLHALAASGSSVFTLGFATEPGKVNVALEIAAAGTGLLVVHSRSPTCRPCTPPSGPARPRSPCWPPGPACRPGAPRC